MPHDAHIVTPRGVKRLVGGSGRGPLYDAFFGIASGDEYELSQSDDGYAQAYLASVLAWRCINVIANTFASLPLTFTNTETDEVIEPPHPAHIALGDKSTRIFRTTAKDMLIFGRAFWEPLRARSRFFRLNPKSIEVIANEYGIVAYSQRLNGQAVREWPADGLVYFFEYNPLEDLAGYSPTMVALDSIQSGLNTQVFLNEFFANGAMMSGILSTEKDVQPTTADRIKDMFRKTFTGTKNAGRTALLPMGVTYQPITPPLKDLDLSALDETISRRICQAYGVPLTLALATDAANFATSKEQRQSFYTETVLPFADSIFDTVNEHALPMLAPNVMISVDTSEIETLQEDRTEITARATQAYAGGIMTLNEAREREGLAPIEGGDVLNVAGQLITIADIEAGNLPTPQAQSPFGLATDAREIEPEPVTKTSAGSLRAVLKIEPSGALKDLFDTLRATYPSAEWRNVNDLDIVIAYAPDCDNDTAQAYAEAVQVCDKPSVALSLKLGSLHSADELFRHALFFRIRRDADLEALASSVASAMACEPREPRMVMGYLTSKAPYTTYQGKTRITASALTLEYEDTDGNTRTLYEHEFDDGMTSERKAKRAELQAWRRKVARKGATAPFSPDVLGSAESAFIRMALDVTQDDPRTVLDNAIRALEDEDESAVTPEEFERYWEGIDQLYAEVADDFDTVFDGMLDKIAAQLRQGNTDMSAIFAEYEDEFVRRAESVLQRLWLAGVGRGNDVLRDERLNANPSKALNLLIDWSIFNPLAIEYARETVREQGGLLTQTNERIFADKFAAWIENGGTLEDLARTIQGDMVWDDVQIPASLRELEWATSLSRARLVAQTITTEAFSSGVIARWYEAGVEEIRWRTQNDRLVCKTCEDLNNRKGDIAQGVRGADGKFYKPPAHPGCRCFPSPVL